MTKIEELEKADKRHDDELIIQGKMIKDLRGELTALRKLFDKSERLSGDEFIEKYGQESVKVSESAELRAVMARQAQGEPIEGLKGLYERQKAKSRDNINPVILEALNPYIGGLETEG